MAIEMHTRRFPWFLRFLGALEEGPVRSVSVRPDRLGRVIVPIEQGARSNAQSVETRHLWQLVGVFITI